MTIRIVDWTIGPIVFAIGISNLLLVHPVPGLVFLLASSVYLPPVSPMIHRRFGSSALTAAKVILGVGIVWFTLGVSDLGDMID